MTETIKVGPFIYTVERVLDLKSKEGIGLFGEIDYALQVIRLEQEMLPVRTYAALWHEVLHAVDDGYQLGLGEQGVGTLATVITQLLQDNPVLCPTIST